jgi:hypothetical protein
MLTKLTTVAEELASVSPETALEQLRLLRTQFAEYVQLRVTDAKAFRRVANINELFKQASMNTVGASSAVGSALGIKPQDLLRESEEAARWSAVEDELRTMLKGVAAANLVRRYRVGLASLQAYNIARQLVRQDEHLDLLPHVQEMKRLKKLGRRRKDADQPQAKPPAPAPTL